jgi:hypothetical protein
MFWFSSRSVGEALSGVESQVFARVSKVVSEIGDLLYLYLSSLTLSPSSYMFCSCFVLSFDVRIVTITWSLLFVVIALSVICLTR